MQLLQITIKYVQSALKMTFERETDLNQICPQSNGHLLALKGRQWKDQQQQQQIEQPANPISASNATAVTAVAAAGSSIFQIEINWKQTHHIEEGKYLNWNSFTPFDLCLHADVSS